MAEAAPKIPPEVIQKPKFEVITGGKKEPGKVATAVPPKRLWPKIVAPIAGFFIGTTGVGVGLGEANKLPEPLQETYNEAFHKDRISYDENGTPVVEITTETTQTPKTTASTVTETTSPIIQETVPPTTEAIEVGPVEYEGVMINPIEGLRFDNGNFFAQEGNPYGLEAETKAGVFIKDAFELNGQMENSIGLRPEVIEILQQKYLEENKELRFPIPFNLEKDKGITMEVVKDEIANNAENLNSIRWADFTVLGINAPKDTIIYAPLRTNMDDVKWGGCGLGLYSEGIENSYQATIVVLPSILDKILYAGKENIHRGYFNIAGQNIDLLTSSIKKDNLNLSVFDNKIITDIGTPLFTIINNEPAVDSNISFKGEFILNIYFSFRKYKELDGEYIIDKEFQTGQDIFLKLEDSTSISILPANVTE